MAASSLVTEWVKGKQMEEALTIKNEEIVNYLSLPPIKFHYSILAENSIKAAVKNYKEKHGKSTEERYCDGVDRDKGRAL
ncbi:Iron-sulfur cluster assembly protein 3 [Morus notabilis]|uniref:Iron-sulfur cluster assembly protein 3 n=1 Tax=Morus notabilis TaxID=981085 RepID=W9S764_9ROSA|nr:Iron-sulfur cluster assembly protein 3 [Morus notabilis]